MPLVGFLMDTTLAAAHLVFAGVPERYPKIKWVLCHMGGAVPYLAERFDRGYEAFAECRANISRAPSTYLKQFYYDTVNFDQNCIELAIKFAGADHILAGSDYPHQIGSIPKMLDAVSRLPVSPAEREGIAGRNAAPTARGLSRTLVRPCEGRHMRVDMDRSSGDHRRRCLPRASRSGSRRAPAAASRSSKTAKCRCGSRSSRRAQPLGLHRHDHGRALISLNGGTLNVVDGSGKVLDVYKLEAGKAMWLEADKAGTQHADVNPGKTAGGSDRRAVEERQAEDVEANFSHSPDSSCDNSVFASRSGLLQAPQPAPAPPPGTDIYLVSMSGGLASMKIGEAVADFRRRPATTTSRTSVPTARRILFAANRDGKQSDVFVFDRAERACHAADADRGERKLADVSSGRHRCRRWFQRRPVRVRQDRRAGRPAPFSGCGASMPTASHRN